jgi:hypothetical protein
MSKILIVIILSAVVTVGAAMQSASSSLEGTNPLSNRQGLEPGLAPVPQAQEPRARVLIRKVKVAEAGTQRPYDRREFGQPWTDDSAAPWAHNQCGTRDDVLKRDLSGETFRDGHCVVITGQLDDPYTGHLIVFSKQRAQAVQVDHVTALHYAWEHGADRWSDEKREEYANDPLVLLAVDGPTNILKSDHGPSEWLPPNQKVWCALAVRQAQVEVKYHLTITKLDKYTMLRVCS